MNRFTLALTLLLRDARARELTILLAALVIAVSASTAITLFADRLHRTMTAQAADFLAADLVITGPERIDASWLDKARQLHLESSETVEFSSVLMEHDALLLAGIKAVSPHYPLRGFLKITDSNFNSERTVHAGPGIGQAWVDRRILSALKLQLGDSLTVGEKKLRITQILDYEPDKRGNLYSLSPRVMMNSADLPATRLIQPGSHVHYFFQFSGTAAAVTAFNHWVEPRLNPSQRLMDIHEDRPELGSALSRAERYLGLSSIVVVLIAGTAIATATRRYSERHFNATAILRCLGCKRKDVLWLYGSQFVALGLVGSAVGCLFGWLLQEALLHLLKNLLPQQTARPGLSAVFFGFGIGMAILIGFALPPLLRLQRVSPLRVLRRELEPQPTSARLVYTVATVIIAGFVWRYTGDFQMTAIILGGGWLALLLLSLLVYGVLAGARRLSPGLSMTWRFGVQGLTANSRASVGQILAFGVTLAAMMLSFTVRNDLLENWRRQLPADAPNYFVLNIFPDQQQSLRRELKRHRIAVSRFYPVVRGRLAEIDSTPVRQIVSKDSQGERATHRDLSLTWSARLPEDNRIVAGEWWRGDGAGRVSIEQKLAQSLGVGVGDVLTFTVGSERFAAVVASVRSVKWDTMKPNFYMIFAPGTLDRFAETYIGSFYLPQSQKNLLNQLVKHYPSITLLEVDLLLQQFKTILAQLTQAINYLLYFALLAGLTVLFAAVHAGLDQRLVQAALMRTLGAERAFLTKVHIIEFSLLGGLAGLLAVALSQSIQFALYREVLQLDYTVALAPWLLMPLLGALLVGAVGNWGVSDIVERPPLDVLSEV